MTEYNNFKELKLEIYLHISFHVLPCRFPLNSRVSLCLFFVSLSPSGFSAASKCFYLINECSLSFHNNFFSSCSLKSQEMVKKKTEKTTSEKEETFSFRLFQLISNNYGEEGEGLQVMLMDFVGRQKVFECKIESGIQILMVHSWAWS
jgi:hypothetical protein